MKQLVDLLNHAYSPPLRILSAVNHTDVDDDYIVVASHRKNPNTIDGVMGNDAHGVVTYHEKVVEISCNQTFWKGTQKNPNAHFIISRFSSIVLDSELTGMPSLLHELG